MDNNNSEDTTEAEESTEETQGETENTGAENETTEGTGSETEVTVEELQDELASVRLALKKANRESAKRRLKIKELEGTSKESGDADKEDKEAAKLQKQLDTLQSQLAETQSENRTLKLRGQVRNAAGKLKVSIFSEEALDDAVTHALKELDEEYDDEDILAVVKGLTKSRAYLFQKAEKSTNGTGSGTDASKKGTSDVVVTEDEEAEIARRFNIKT